MANTNVEFYEKVKHFEEQKQDSEKRSLLLEQQLSMNASSDKKIHGLRVAQLQNYWRKLCEDEKRSQRRNEQLLRDLNRIDEHAARLAEKTEKLRTLKCEYEAYIEKTYPNWKEKIRIRQQQRKAATSYEHQIYSEPRSNELVQPFFEGSGLIQQPAHGGIVQQHPRTSGFIEQQQGSNGPTNLYHEPNEPIPLYPGPSEPSHPHPGPSGSAYSYPRLNEPAHPNPGAREPAHPYLGANGAVHPHPGQNRPSLLHSEAKELRTQSIRPTEFRKQRKSDELQRICEENGPKGDDRLYTNTHSLPYKEEPLVASDGSAHYFTPSNQNRDLQPGRSESLQRRTDEPRTLTSDSQTKASIESPAKNPASKDPISIPAKVRASRVPAANRAEGPAFTEPAKSSAEHLASDSPVDSPLQQPDSSSRVSGPEKGNVKEPLSTKEVNNVMTSPVKKTGGLNRAEQKEEIQTDRTYASEISDFEEDTDHNDNLSNSNDAIKMRHESKSVSIPRPDVSLQGFCRMLQAIEAEVSLGRSPKFYFRSATPRTSVIQEIIANANRGSPLLHFNVDSIALVILEQLPCLSMNSKSSCLLTDEILTSLYREVDNKTVRDLLDPSDHLLWDSLYSHFLILLQHKILSVTEIADIFAPLLVAGNSKLQKQAIVLVTKILEAVSEEELNMATPRSTSDFSLASYHRPSDCNVSQAAFQSVKLSTNITDEKQKVRTAARAASPSFRSPPPHPTSLPGLPMGNSLGEDRFPISKDPQETLTQTAAYKQLLASTSMSHKLPDMESDEDDEIEKNLSQHFTNSGPPTANKTSEENIKSPKSPDNLKSPKSPKSDSARSNFSDDSLKQEIDRKNSLALKSASLKSGRSAVESIMSRVNEDFDLDDADPPVPTSSLKKLTDCQAKERKNVEDDDDFWA